MSRDPAAIKQFLFEFVVAWLVAFALGLIAWGMWNALLVNVVTALGGGQFASGEDTTAALVRGIRLFAPSTAMFSAVYVLISLFAATQLAPRYPRRRGLVYAACGAVVPLAFGLTSLSFYWLSAVIGAIALFAAAQVARGYRA